MAVLPAPPAHSSLKRRRAESESDSSASGALPDGAPCSKRVKVKFGLTEVIRYSQTPSAAPGSRPPAAVEDSLEAIRLEVALALKGRLSGDDERFDILRKTLESLNDSASVVQSGALLYKYLIAFTEKMTALSGKCSPIVYTVLECSWIGRDESFVRLYVRFLALLTSAHVGYAKAVFRSLLNMFRSLPSSAGRLAGYPAVRRPELRRRLHNTLRYLLQLVPTASSVVAALIEPCYPKAQDPAKSYIDFASNLLHLSTYSPEIKSEVLARLLSQVVKVDVQIQVKMDDLEEDLAEAFIDRLDERADLAVDEADLSGDEEVDSESDSEDEDDDYENTAKLRKLKADVEHMDGVLDVIFSHYHKVFAAGSEDQKSDVFDNLMNQFRQTLLPSYRSRHTQFLLFHFSQTRPEFVDTFAGNCINIMFDKSKSPLIQLAASSYLSSFISRGARISSFTIGEVFGLLLDQLDNYRLDHEAACRGPDIRKYGGYYCMVQAALYIFCFRWRDLVQDEDIEDTFWDYYDSGKDFPWNPEIRDILSQNIFSPLNPLKVCNQSIVSQFAKVSAHLRFVYVHTLLDSNRRVRLCQSLDYAQRALSSASSLDNKIGYQLRQTALSHKRDDATFQLDAYFPFDPYQLPKSKRWLEGDYVEWKGVPGLDDDNSTDGDDDNNDDEAPTDDEEDEDEDEDDDDDDDTK